ncbi:MAG: hypothetical protein WD231_03975 [Candidatus Woykebacteria bacterium]
MKYLKIFLKKTIIFILASAIFTILMTIFITYFLSLPRLNSYQSLKPENKELIKEIDDLSGKISNLAGQDRGEIEDFYTIVSSLIPSEKDLLRDLSILENLAASSKVQMEDVAARSSASGRGSTPATSTTTLNPAVPSGNYYTLEITIKGGFRNILKFISNLEFTDRLLGAGDITIKGQDEDLTASVVLELPVEKSNLAPTLSDDLFISSADREKLLSLSTRIKFKGKPANNPLGVPNPFK